MMPLDNEYLTNHRKGKLLFFKPVFIQPNNYYETDHIFYVAVDSY